MPSEDHYEMREYNIDVLQDEKNVPLYAKERPYPIYPSKRGSSPTFLRDIIARYVLHRLPFCSCLFHLFQLFSGVKFNWLFIFLVLGCIFSPCLFFCTLSTRFISLIK